MSDYNYHINDENDENDENDLEETARYKQFEIREGIAFLIELTPELLLPLKELNYKSQLFEIISGINELMSDMIITLPSTGIGLYFYNCEESSVTKLTKIPGLRKLFSLNDLNVTNMKLLNDLVSDDLNNIKNISRNFIYKNTNNSEQLPLILNKMLDELTRKSQYNNKKLIWFTNNDKPYREPATKQQLWRIINDYESLNYYIDPIFLDKYNDPEQTKMLAFDMKLYQDIFLNTNYLNNKDSESISSEYSNMIFDGASKNTAKFQHTLFTNRIKSSIFRLKEIRRIQFACNLIIGNKSCSDFGCSIKGYSLYNPEKIKKFIHVYTKGEYPKRVYSESKIVNKTSNEQITLEASKDKSIAEIKDQANIRKGFKLSGGEVLYLNLQQQNFLKNYSFDHDPDLHEKQTEEINEEYEVDANQETISYSKPPYLKVLGFRSLSQFQPSYHSSSAIFVTADLDNGIKASSGYGFSNSFTTFSSLYQSCLYLKKYAIVFGCTKRNALPCLYALYPTKAQGSSRLVKGQRDFPEGFLLIRLPWLEDIRSLPNNILTDNRYLILNSDIPPSILENYKHLISNFLIDAYNPSQYPNPSLNYFYKVIKHNLLQIEISESLKDLSKNDCMIQKLLELRNELIEYDHIGVIHDINRALNNIKEDFTNDEPPLKKPKIEGITFKFFLEEWKKNQCKNITVVQLKELAKSKGLKVYGRKNEVIEGILEYCKSNNIE